MWGKKKEQAPDEYKVELGDDLAPLMEKFKPVIDDLLKGLEGDFEKCADTGLEYDDIFVLRFVLALKGDKAAIIAKIKEGLDWRAENRELLKTLIPREDGTGFYAGAKGSPEYEQFESIRNQISGGLLAPAGELQVPLQVNRPLYTMQKVLLKTVPKEVLVQYTVLQNEGIFKLCDQRTRDTGKIVQSIGFVDFNGYGPRGKDSDVGFMKTMRGAGTFGEFLHPMLVAKKVGVHLSTAMSMMLSAARTPMVTVKSTKKPLIPEIAAKWPTITRFGIPEALPPFLGGIAPCPPFYKKTDADDN